MEVRIVDVSDEGLGVETLERLPFLARAPLRVEIDGKSLEWIGEMKWCRVARIERKDDDSRPVFAAGFHILCARANSTGAGVGSLREAVVEALRSRQSMAAWSPGPIR